MDFIKGIFNAVADPRLFFLLAVLALVVMVWKRETVASNAVGYGAARPARRCSSSSATFDPNFRLIVTKPDNVPIVGLIFLLVFFVWYSIREGGAERPADRGGAGADREGGVGSRLGVARPGLHRADLADPLLGGPDRLVDLPEGAARAAGEPGRTRRTRRRRRGTSSACRKCWSTSIPGWPASCCPA